MVDRTEPEQENKQTESKEKRHSIPLGTVRRLMRENGVEKASASAVEEVAMMLDEVVRDISNEAIVFRNHAKRKTVMKDDILIAMRR
jgi:histone H3/H4